MFTAAMSGDLTTLASLLDREPSLLHCEYQYRNPLHFAVRENQIDAAKLLLKRGSKITYTAEKWHSSAGQMAEDRGYSEMSQVLSDYQQESFGICTFGDEIAASFQSYEVEQTKLLIDRHGVAIADARGNQPLHWAVMTRQLPLIAYCLDARADINAIRPDGARPLDLSNGDYWFRGWQHTHALATENHWTLVDYLIEKGAEYDLTTACRIGDFARVKEIVERDPEAANRDALYNTWYSGFPLRSAAKAGHLEIVQYLFKKGADPNKSEHGLAPFGGSVFDATQNGHYEVVKCLLENGANANQEVESSGCPLSVARDKPTKELLRAHGATYDVFGCLYYGHAKAFAEHCERDSSVANDPELFMMAAQRGDREMVDCFLKYQPDIWKRMPAQLGKTREVTEWMIECGMNVNQTTWLDTHELHKNFTADELEMWIELGVNLDLIDSEHQSTPLGLAARRGNVEQVQWLIDGGADTSAARGDWARPLEWAKRRGHDEIVAILR